MRQAWHVGLLGLLPSVLLAGCSELTLAEREKTFGRNSPSIVEGYAQDKMLYSHPWVIFLHGEDPDADMAEIGAWVKVSGGQLEFARVTLSRDLGRKFKGYVWLPLRQGRGHNFNTITVNLYVKDRAGHPSDEKVFRLQLGEQTSGEAAARIRAYEKEYDVALGPIGVSLAFVEGDAAGGGVMGGGD